jgi:PEP-CTERM/exosortase A-associated glycosyltransferase
MSSIANDAPTPKRIGSDGPLSAGLRVLHVLDHSAPLQSGYVSRTLAILREQRKLGWETAQLTTPRQGSALEGEEVQAGFTFQRTAGPGLVANAVPFLREWSEMTATTARILQVAESFTPQLIHAHSPVLNALPALRAARRLGLPVVYEVRAFWEDASVHNGSTTEGSPRYRASRAIESFVLRRVDAVTTICEGLRHDILARGISPNRVTVIPNGVDIETFEPTPKDTQSPRQKFRLQGRIVLGFVGSFYGSEGSDLLLHAVTMMGTAAEDIAILLVGGGPCDETWRALATTLGLGRQVVFAGRVPYEDVAAHYDLIDLFIYPRRSMRLTELVPPRTRERHLRTPVQT